MHQGGKPVRLRLQSTARELPAGWSANVIGEIPGRERRNEIVLLGAHLDSWDLGQGAVDDGAGVAIVVEAARLIAKLERKPARTMRVVLFANEEFGLSGAREYARQSPMRSCAATSSRWKRTSAPGPVWRIDSQVAPEAVGVDRNACARCLKPLSMSRPASNTAHGGSDLGPLRAPACRCWICRWTRRTTSTCTTR